MVGTVTTSKTITAMGSCRTVLAGFGIIWHTSQHLIHLGIIQFGDLCDEVTKVGMAPRGVVKMVLDGLIDTLNININKGFSVQLGDFGCFRPGINAKSQDKQEDVKSDTVYRRKIIFTPGQYFKEMLTRASVTRANWENSETTSGGGSNPDAGGNGEEENPLG